jgi:2-polyprenyl-3-methyl-5-hydroxy-6-metoxy-1,4-benzoquinol methylase
MYEDKPGRKMLEIGPGVGVCSLSLKKMLDIDVTWLTVPDDEPQWNAWRSKSSLNLYKKYDIHIKEAAVETDQFDGEYDIIFMSQVMEHFIFNPVGTIRKLMTHLKEDGVMFISVPDIIYNNPKNVESYKEIPFYEDLSVREAVRRTMINSFTHYHEYSYEEALEVFDECGLQCVDSHTNLPIHHFILKRK